MKKASPIKQVSVLLAFTLICGVAALSAGTPEAQWYSIVPPLLAVSLALLTGRIILSLIAAVVVGGFLAHVPAAPGSVGAWGKGAGSFFLYVWNSASDPTNLQILVFVVFVISLIAVIIVGGGLQAVISWLMRFAKGARSTQLVTALMGVAIFIDDYTNTMIVGSAMRPLSDQNRVSREKLAFLVDATSAPISGIAVISTWIGYEVGLFAKAAQSLGIPQDGYSIFFDALPFRFYCILMIAFVFLNLLLDGDFGPMAKAQERARTTGEVLAPDAKPLTASAHSTVEMDPSASPRLITAVLPIITLFGILIVGLWRDGGGFAREGLAILNPTAWREVISASENNILILAISSGLALVVAAISVLLFSRIPAWKVGRAVAWGFKSSLLPIVILILAWSLKASCDELKTGMFLTSAVGNALSPLWFPAAVFVIAGITAFATGTSWGTMAILIPTASPLAFQLDGGSYGLVTIISFSAILDGAIFGDHCSPVSDTTIMSSISTGCDHMAHVRTQLPYALVTAITAILFGYLPAAYGISPWIGWILGVVVLAAVMLTLRKSRAVSA